MNPKVSICIPAYKQADKLQLLFQTIQQQTFRDFEVIVTDDSPTDDVEKLCRQQSAFDLKYYRNSVAKGSPDNWNSAISYAQGEWVKLIHHDDYFNSPDALQYFVDEAEKSPQIDYFYCGTNILDELTGKQYPYGVPLNQLRSIDKYPAYLFPRNIIGSPSTGFFRRSTFIEYDKSLIWLVDVEYYCRVIKQYKIKYIPSLLITTVISTKQLSAGLKNNKEVEIRELLYCYVKFRGTFNKINMRVIRYRVIEIFQKFDICSLQELKSLRLISPIPIFVKLFIISININKKLAYRIFYKLNHFNIF
jgi:glycosyltransferase involved in cell wall biosynthesis